MKENNIDLTCKKRKRYWRNVEVDCVRDRSGYPAEDLCVAYVAE